MSSNEFFGWDLLYKTIQNEIAKESDVVIAFVHWFLIRKASFKCIGVGDDKTFDEKEEGSELLPDGWNKMKGNYALRYAFNSNLYNLLGAESEKTLIVNLLDSKTRNVSNIAFSPKEAVKSLKGPLKTMIPTASELLDRLNKELVDPVFKGNTKEVTTQTAGANSTSARHIVPEYASSDPLMIGRPRVPGMGYAEIDPLRDVGRGDLDPLGRGGGGMLFSPPSLGSFPGPAGSFPGGSRIPPPPGSRFDPFGPPDTIRPNPNASHFRPPPDFDDMYM